MGADAVAASPSAASPGAASPSAASPGAASPELAHAGASAAAGSWPRFCLRRLPIVTLGGLGGAAGEPRGDTIEGADDPALAAPLPRS